MTSEPPSSPTQAIRHELQNWEHIRIHEVQTIDNSPTLCRQWMADGVRNENVGSLVRDTVAESDTAITASFKTFVKSQSHPQTWFTFLCKQDTVLAMATCKAIAPSRSAMRRMRIRLSSAVTPDTLQRDHDDDRFFVVVNSDHTIHSVSTNAPVGPHLTRALDALTSIHRQPSQPMKWVAWIPGYMVEFHPMDHSQTTTVATLTPAGRATVPQLAQLTPAQAQIVRFAANGSTAPEIARSLNRSTETVRTHLRAAYRSLHVCSRIELLPSAQELTQWGAV